MSANKVILNGETIIDLTQDTATEDSVAEGYLFHKANGEQAVGKASFVNTTPNGQPISVSTETAMTALLENGNVGSVYKYTGTTGTYENGAYYVLEEQTSISECQVTFDITLPSAQTCTIHNESLHFSYQFNSGNAFTHIVETVTIPATSSMSDPMLFNVGALPTGGTSIVTGSIEQKSSDWGLMREHEYHITGDGTITITIDGWD